MPVDHSQAPAAPAGPSLFRPYRIRGVEFANRIWVSPMCQYSCDDLSGEPHDWHLAHLGGFARGRAGLVFTEATGVSPVGRISPQDTGIYTDAQVAAWRRIVDFVHGQGAPIGMQLSHAGRKASAYRPWDGRRETVPAEQGGWTPLAPSALPHDGRSVPRELTTEEVQQVAADFVAAARRAMDAGFDVLEVHNAHGYLLHQFLSPLSNERTDAYGGSPENRARLLLEIVRGIRAEVGADVPLFVRFSATDHVEGGLTTDDVAVVAGWARDAGADLFDISSGGLVPATFHTGPGYQVPYAEEIAELAGVEVSAVGMITTAEQAEAIVSGGRVQAVMLARELIRDPHFPLRAAHELGHEIAWPPAYERGRWPQAPAGGPA